MSLALLLEIAKERLADRDASHGLAHALRVMKRAVILAKGKKVDLESIQIAAIAHDFQDKKYTEITADNPSEIPSILTTIGITNPEQVSRIIAIIDGVSYSKEKQQQPTEEIDIHLAIVQDADRLDALGAIGIARCFIFAGKHNESVEQALEHIMAKLPDVVKRMKTDAGRQMARELFKPVENFCVQLKQELQF